MIFTDNPILFWHDMAMYLLKQNKSKNMHLFEKENVYITHTIGQNGQISCSLLSSQSISSAVSSRKSMSEVGRIGPQDHTGSRIPYSFFSQPWLGSGLGHQNGEAVDDHSMVDTVNVWLGLGPPEKCDYAIAYFPA